MSISGKRVTVDWIHEVKNERKVPSCYQRVSIMVTSPRKDGGPGINNSGDEFGVG